MPPTTPNRLLLETYTNNPRNIPFEMKVLFDTYRQSLKSYKTTVEEVERLQTELQALEESLQKLEGKIISLLPKNM